MAVQTRTDITNRSYFLGRKCFNVRGLTVEQDADRDGDIEKFTVMAWNATRDKLIPLTDNTATDGTQIPCGLMGHTVEEADIIAGDVDDCVLYVWTESANESLIVLENDLELDDTVQVGSVTPVVAEIISADASDLASAITLVNEIKTSLNAANTTGETSLLRTIRDELARVGIQIRRGEFVSMVENS